MYLKTRFIGSAGLITLTAMIALMAPASAKPTPEAAQEFGTSTPVCGFGWSKDTCQGKLSGHALPEYTCNRVIAGTTYTCRTVEVNGATFEIDVRQSSGGCGSTFETLCDETGLLNGIIRITGDFTFRTLDNCRFRGSWKGSWQLIDTGGNLVASGTGSGPLGTGSHRVPTCATHVTQCNPDCEGCHDSQFIPGPIDPNGVWEMGVEGSLLGTVFAGAFTSSEINVSISGTLRARGTPAGPQNFGQWSYCGTTDGIVWAKCSNAG